MKAITLRNLSPNVARIIQQRAKQKKTSVNKAVIELLEESQGVRRKKKAPVRYHDLDHLVETWTKEEADAFDKIVRSFRDNRSRLVEMKPIWISLLCSRATRGISVNEENEMRVRGRYFSNPPASAF